MDSVLAFFQVAINKYVNTYLKSGGEVKTYMTGYLLLITSSSNHNLKVGFTLVSISSRLYKINSQSVNKIHSTK